MSNSHALVIPKVCCFFLIQGQLLNFLYFLIQLKSLCPSLHLFHYPALLSASFSMFAMLPNSRSFAIISSCRNKHWLGFSTSLLIFPVIKTQSVWILFCKQAGDFQSARLLGQHVEKNTILCTVEMLFSKTERNSCGVRMEGEMESCERWAGQFQQHLAFMQH